MNALRDKIEAGEQLFGLWKMLPDTLSAEVAGNSGYDYVCVDLQHGLLGTEDLLGMLQAIRAGGAEPLVRVPKNDLAEIGRALDFGAAGVVIPLVNDATEARAAAEACLFPPRGKRSFGPVRAAQLTGSAETGALDDSVLCIVMVETAEGLDNAAEIAATEGVDGIYIGPADLGLGIGIAPTTEIRDEKHSEAIEKVRTVCEEAGIICGMHSDGAEQARRHSETGFDLLTVRSDHGILTTRIPAELKTAKSKP